MSATTIFFVGFGVSTLCFLGLYFTITEISRLGRGSEVRARVGKR